MNGRTMGDEHFSQWWFEGRKGWGESMDNNKHGHNWTTGYTVAKNCADHSPQQNSLSTEE
jgi:hypothetical protein